MIGKLSVKHMWHSKNITLILLWHAQFQDSNNLDKLIISLFLLKQRLCLIFYSNWDKLKLYMQNNSYSWRQNFPCWLYSYNYGTLIWTMICNAISLERNINGNRYAGFTLYHRNITLTQYNTTCQLVSVWLIFM